VNRLLRDCAGSVLVEATLSITVFMLVVFGTVDVTLMLFNWQSANKAAVIGARTAIVSNPVASGITNLSSNYDPSLLGQSCLDTSTTDGNGGGPSGNCPQMSATCTPASSGGSCPMSCTAGGAGTCPSVSFDDTAFTTIFNNMHAIYPSLTRQNVVITYKTNNLGYVGQSNGLPMDVTVSISCVSYQFYFIDALMKWVFSTPSGCPSGTKKGVLIPSFATTLTSESMVTQ